MGRIFLIVYIYFQLFVILCSILILNFEAIKYFAIKLYLFGAIHLITS